MKNFILKTITVLLAVITLFFVVGSPIHLGDYNDYSNSHNWELLFDSIVVESYIEVDYLDYKVIAVGYYTYPYLILSISNNIDLYLLSWNGFVPTKRYNPTSKYLITDSQLRFKIWGVSK